MPPVTGIGSLGPVQPTSDAGHSGHTISGSGTSSFAAALSQVMGRTTSTVLSGTPSPASSTGGAQSSAQRDAWPSLGGGVQPRHIPLVGSGHPSHDFQQLALGLRAYRQQIIASNIANADTPGYKAVDIDFQEALRNAQAAANVPPVSLTTTSGGALVRTKHRHPASHPAEIPCPQPRQYRWKHGRNGCRAGQVRGEHGDASVCNGPGEWALQTCNRNAPEPEVKS